MVVESLEIQGFRNHLNTKLEFSPGLNVLYGLNGMGKTSVLEALSVCGLSKSFLNVQDSTIVNFESDFFRTGAKARNDLGIPHKVNLMFTPGKKKRISNSSGDNLNPKDIIGNIPIVALAPDHKEITGGSPGARRQFMDSVLAQSGRVYYDSLVKLKKCLKQRNSMLSDVQKFRGAISELIPAWTDVLIETGSEIAVRRNKFIRKFNEVFKEVYKDVTGGREEVEIIYYPDHIADDVLTDDFAVQDAAGEYYKAAEALKEREFARGSTLFGPQKDDLIININGVNSRYTASQGQHKSLLISLKFAEFEYLKNIKNENPLFLLDDIFSELDSERTSKVLELVTRDSSQTFITVTNKEMMSRFVPPSDSCYFFEVDSGRVNLNTPHKNGDQK